MPPEEEEEEEEDKEESRCCVAVAEEVTVGALSAEDRLLHRDDNKNRGVV